MSGEDKDPKASPEKSPVAPAARTVVGVPALSSSLAGELDKTDEGWAADEPPPIKLPVPEPSSTLVESPGHRPEKEDPNTGVDVKAMSAAEAERVLAWTGFTQEEIPTAQAAAEAAKKKAGSPISPKATTVAGAIKKPAPGAAHVKTPSHGSELFAGLGGKGKRQEPEQTTKAGVAPQPATVAKGRTTLLLDSSVPAQEEPDDADATMERPPIVVPGSSTTAPKAVTQPPPWGEGAVRMAPGIPKSARPPEPVEELSGSLLVPADATGDQPAMRASESSVEELSGSLLVEDPADGKGPPVVKKMESKAPPVPSRPPPQAKSVPTQLMHARPGAASAKPAPPTSLPRHPISVRTQIGMGIPELPKATPAPKVELPPLPRPPSQSPVKTAPIAAQSKGTGEAAAPLPPPPLPPPPLPQGPEAQAEGPSQSDREVHLVPQSPLHVALRRVSSWAQQGKRGAQRGWRWVEGQRWTQQGRQLAERLWARVQAIAPVGSALRGPRPAWFYPVIAGAGLVVGIGLVGLIVSLARHGGSSDGDAQKTSSSSSGSSAKALATTPATSSPAGAAATAPAATSLTACTLGGSAHVIAPAGTLVAGVEVVRLGDAVAVGFASDDHDAMAVRLDPSSLSSSATAKAHSAEVIRRVTPMATAKGGLSLVVDADRPNDKLHSRRAVAAVPPLQLGIADGHVVWTKVGGPIAGKLWSIDGEVDALRGVADATNSDRTLGLALRSGGAVWVGTAAGSSALAAKGELSRIEGLGTGVGSPAIAINDGAIFVAWADRSASADPWRLRWVRFGAGDPPGEARAFVPPAGGGGDSVMSPGVAPLPGGRFLLVWTEGPAKQRAVRALTLAANGTPVGPPLAVSNAGINAGQGQAAVLPDGHGVIAFLESTDGGGFQVMGASVSCAN